VEVVVVEGHRQPEGGHLLGPSAYDGKVGPQPVGDLRGQRAWVVAGQPGVLLDARGQVVDRLLGPELGHSQRDQLAMVRHQRPLEEGGLARQADPVLEVAARRLGEDLALVRREQEAVRGRAHRNDALGDEPGQGCHQRDLGLLARAVLLGEPHAVRRLDAPHRGPAAQLLLGHRGHRSHDRRAPVAQLVAEGVGAPTLRQGRVALRQVGVPHGTRRVSHR
jgi:hypothetical protein